MGIEIESMVVFRAIRGAIALSHGNVVKLVAKLELGNAIGEAPASVDE
ncbi:MAG: hypothetical protein HC878_17860 [Leptolyngbyaceae cyanobacterium SL_5_14]|nr:hypothetical protein [Leptolyngbyaceae cyanobacterium SL_5_14]